MVLGNVSRGLSDFLITESTSVEVFHCTGRKFSVDPSRETALVPLGDGFAVLQEIGFGQEVRLLPMGVFDMGSDIRGAGVMSKITQGTLVETSLLQMMAVNVNLSVFGLHLLETFLTSHPAVIDSRNLSFFLEKSRLHLPVREAFLELELDVFGIVLEAGDRFQVRSIVHFGQMGLDLVGFRRTSLVADRTGEERNLQMILGHVS